MGRASQCTVAIIISSTAPIGVSRAITRILGEEPRPDSPLLVPSSGRADDSLLSLVSASLRDNGLASEPFVPPTGARSLVGGGWANIKLELPDLPNRHVRIATELTSWEPWIVCDVDAVAARGPFVLDVFSRHLHPRDRLRQIADRERARRSVEINLAVRAGWCILGFRTGSNHLVAATRDVIAAELVSLALSECALGPTIATTGPWEDPVVQRATELDLGVRIPLQISFVVEDEFSEAVSVLERVAGRLGVRL